MWMPGLTASLRPGTFQFRMNLTQAEFWFMSQAENLRHARLSAGTRLTSGGLPGGRELGALAMAAKDTGWSSVSASSG